MKILSIGDPHFKIGNKKETDEMFREIERLVSQTKFDKIVVLGDILDTHERIHLTVHKRACDFLLMLSNYSETWALIGNHDRVNNQDFMSELHPFTGLEGECLKIVYKTRVCGDLCFVPYVPPGKFDKALEGVDIGDMRIVFAHQEFKGAKMGAIVSQDGDEWPEDYPLVISGHIHDYQTLGNVIYVGTPFQHGFSDSIDKKLMIIDIGDDISIKRKKINITRKKSVKLTLEEFESYTPLKNCVTKVYVQGDSKIIREYFERNKEKLSEYNLKVCIRDTSHKDCIPEEKHISFEEYLKSKLGEELYLKFEELIK